MYRAILTFALLFFLAFNVQSQDFKIVDFTKGYYGPHPLAKQMKLNVTKKWVPLSSFDYDKDGKQDSVFYKYSLKGGTFATIVTYDATVDDWVTLYKLDVKDMKPTDGVWFYETTLKDGGMPAFVVYSIKDNYKSVTIIQWDPAKKQLVSKEYPVEAKSFFPHKLVVNKKKIINQNTSTEENYEEIPVDVL